MVDQHRQLVPAVATCAWRRTAACSSPTGTTPASAATAWATGPAAASTGVTPKGHKGYKVPKVELETKEGVLAALGSPNLAVRYMAMAKLREHEAARRSLEVAGRRPAEKGRNPLVLRRASSAGRLTGRDK